VYIYQFLIFKQFAVRIADMHILRETNTLHANWRSVRLGQLQLCTYVFISKLRNTQNTKMRIKLQSDVSKRRCSLSVYITMWWKMNNDPALSWSIGVKKGWNLKRNAASAKLQTIHRLGQQQHSGRSGAIRILCNIPNLTHTLSTVCCTYEGWNFNIGNYLFTTDTK